MFVKYIKILIPLKTYIFKQTEYLFIEYMDNIETENIVRENILKRMVMYRNLKSKFQTVRVLFIALGGNYWFRYVNTDYSRYNISVELYDNTQITCVKFSFRVNN